MALADRAELAVRLTLDDRGFTGPLNRVKANLRGLDKATRHTQRALGRTGAALQRTAVIAGAAAAGGFLFAVRAAGDFEQAFAGVVKTVGDDATTTQLDSLRDAIRKMALEIPIGVNQLAALGETAGALGIPVESIDEAIRTAALLGETTNVSAEEAITSLGILGNILHLTADDYDNLGAALVELGNKGASTEAQILDIATRFGGVGKTFGLTADEILGLAEAAASFGGLQPEAAGSSLIRLLQGLTLVVGKGGADLKDLNKLVGTDFRKAIEQDASGALLLFLRSMNKLDRFEKIKVLKDLGISGVFLSQLLEGLGGNIDGLKESFNNAATGWEENTALSEEAARKFATFNSKVDLAKNHLNEMGIVIGDRVLPKILPLLDAFSKWVRDNPKEIERFGDEVAKGFVAVVEGVRNLPWDAIITTMKVAGQVAKTTLGVFTGLPKDFQALLIGAFALNKATGGLVTGVGMDVGGALLNKLLTGSIFGRGATPANPLFVSAVGAGLGVGGRPGPSPGGVGVVGKGTNALINAAALVGIVTSAFAVWETQRAQSEASTQQATEIAARQAEVLPTASVDDIKTQLAAIDTGIAEIRSNPLYTFVQGEALTKLEQMRATAAAQLTDARTSDILMRARIDALGATIRAQPVPNVTVNVNTSVTAGQVQNAVNTSTTWTQGQVTNRFGAPTPRQMD